jgi:KDO2-lipid IV(A) lauroyltransferase
MGIEVPVHTGLKCWQRYDLNVILQSKKKKNKRGYYEATLIPISDDSKSVPDFGITDAFIKEVEKQIYEAPEYYFWTHKDGNINGNLVTVILVLINYRSKIFD